MELESRRPGDADSQTASRPQAPVVKRGSGGYRYPPVGNVPEGLSLARSHSLVLV